MAAEIPLTAKIDVGNETTVHKDDQPSFRNKNTLPYKGLLSNYHSISNKGWITTQGRRVGFSSSTEAKLLFATEKNNFIVTTDIQQPDYTVAEQYKKITNKDLDIGNSIVVDDHQIPLQYTKVVDSRSLQWSVKGEVLDLAFINQPYAIIRSGNLFYLCTEDDQELLLADDAYFTKGQPKIVLSTGSNSSVYEIGDLENAIASIEFPTNNGYWNNGYFVLGYEVEDHYVCRAYYGTPGNYKTHYYQGCIGADGKIFGEPYPIYISDNEAVPYGTPTRLENGVLRWQIEPLDIPSVVNPEPTALDNTDTTVLQNKAAFSQKPYQLLFMFDPINHTINGASTVADTSPYTLYDGHFTGTANRIVVGTSVDLGVLNSSAEITDYDNIFPLAYLFTNIISKKGVDYDYGRGWYKVKYLDIEFTNAPVYSSDLEGRYPVVLEKDCKFAYYYDETQNGSVSLNSLGKSLNISAYTWPTSNYTFGIGSDNNIIAEDIPLSDGRRHHIITDDVINDGWQKWIHTVDFDVADLPFYRNENGYKLFYYGDNLAGIGMNHTLLGPVSTEYSGNYALTTSGDAVVDNFHYNVSENNKIKLSKIADFVFGINIIGDKSVLVENKSSNTYELIRGAVPYNNEMMLSDVINQKTKLARDGSAYNDVWYQAAGVNANLDDKYPTSSSLLPPIELDLYVETDDLEDFNSYAIDGGNPILSPVVDSLAEEDELAVYYTHTQATTDIEYKFSVKNRVKSRNTKFFGNTWWSSADVIIMAIGVGSKFNSINYISSTVELPATYNARLYVNNNTAYLTYNAANQIYHSVAVFTIYASTYYYDGQAIYYTGNLNQTTANELVCYAIGMRFLANSGTEAYFYSDYDKSIYTFTGSNTLAKTTPISMFGKPISSVFSSYNQSLYLLNQKGDVLVLSGESSALFKDTGATSLETIVDGCAFVGDGNYSVYSPKDGDILPIEVDTDWIGDTTKMYKFSFGDIVLFDNDPKESITVTMFLHVLNGIESNSYSKKIEIRKTDWKGCTYRLRMNPENILGNAFKIGICSDDPIHIHSLIIESQTTSATNNAAKGWR